LNRLEAAIQGVVERLFPRADYQAFYPCTVKSQNADLTLELVPLASSMPAHSKVKIRMGAPGIKVKVQPNCQVLLAFEQGDPGRPYAALWSEETVVTEYVIKGTVIKLNDGGTPVAKEGSITTGHQHTLTGTAGPYPISGIAVTQTDTIATGAGSPTVKVP
jgi:hypothetical protein